MPNQKPCHRFNAVARFFYVSAISIAASMVSSLRIYPNPSSPDSSGRNIQLCISTDKSISTGSDKSVSYLMCPKCGIATIKY